MKALLVVAALAAVASASPKIDPAVQAQADGLFEKGEASYQAGRYQEAISEFKQAYELVRDAVYLFNIAQSYRKVGDCASAYDFYGQYLAAAPNAENKDKVKQWIGELQPCVDERRKEQADAARRAQDEAERKRRDDELARPRSAPIANSDPGRPYRIAGIAVGGVGVAGLIVGVGYGIRSGHLKTQVADKCAMSCQWDSPEITSLDDAGHSANLRAWVGYLGGGLAMIGGVALYWYGATRAEVVVTPAPGGATVGAHVLF